MTMRIVVIDNVEWDGANIADVDFKETQLAWSVATFQKNFGSIREELEGVKDAILKDENAHCYLINIHCAIYRKKNKTDFERETPFQSQAGMVIYRELLHIYKECSEKLQVVFFSPYGEKPELIKKKPENLILNHLEFLEVPFTWNKVTTKFEQYNKPAFNNASENLLAGYSIYNSQTPVNSKVAAGSKKILFIDDQSNEWKAVFDEIFHKNAIEHLPYRNQDEFRDKLATGEVEREVKSKLSQCQLILSDFYLKENHDPGKWMNRQNIEKISGFDLFHSIRATDKGKVIPYIMHTSSNKIPYYKIFDQNGVDDWLVKDVRQKASLNEKLDNYILFKQTIEQKINNKNYSKLQILWSEISTINKITTAKWWYSPRLDNSRLSSSYLMFRPVNDTPVDSKYKHTKADVVNVLVSAWMAIRQHINADSLLAGNNASYKVSESEHFIAASICNSIGKVIEMLGVKSGDIGFSFLTNLLLQVRNCASHSFDHDIFILEDAYLALSYLTYGLKNYDTLSDFSIAFPDEFIAKGISNDDDDNFPCGLLWLYLQLYNSESTRNKSDLKNFRELVKRRIVTLYKQAMAKGQVNIVYEMKTSAKGKPKKFIDDIFSTEVNISNLFKTDPIKLPIPSQL